MPDPTFASDWREMLLPLALTILVVGGALAFAFG